jgi:hypothetical protein
VQRQQRFCPGDATTDDDDPHPAPLCFSLGHVRNNRERSLMATGHLDLPRFCVTPGLAAVGVDFCCSSD